MQIIGLTGNIASGKSTVEEIIKNNGYKIIDADFICHGILEYNNDVIEQIKRLFRNFNILDENNKLDRIKIGKIVFQNNDYKTRLQNILHPVINDEIKKFIEHNKNENIIFISVPLLFEANMQKMFDKIILVKCDENTRLQRLIQRNNFTIEHAKERINSQMKEELKIKLSDYIIDNNSDLNNLITKTENILSLINIE